MNGKQMVALALAMSGMLTVSAADGKVPGGGQFFDNVKVPMRDGVNLAADVYVPSNRPAEKIGCLLSFSPYKATAPAKPPMADRAEEWGVATVSADCRGLCHSEGTFEPWDPKLVDDADDLLSWIAAQPWSNGRVVMVGGSYPGNTQLAAMRSGNPALVACAPSVITLDPYPINFQNGILIPQFFKNWHTGLAGSNSWDRLASHPTRDDWWRARADLRNLKKSKARAFYQAGWFDMLGIDTFNTLKEMPEGSVLRIGPWSHGVDTFDNPEINYKELGGLVTEDAEIEFLRSALDGRESESKQWPGKILMYVMGRNEWRYERTWPPEGTVVRAFDFTAGETRSFAHDPKNPVPMKGGRIIHAGGQYDQREIGKRPDVLSYTGEVLAEDLEVIGDVEAELKLSSTAACSDVTVKLVDVYPDGRAMNVLEGINRISFRPGEMTTVRFKLDITAYAFLKGHRIRVDVAGSCAPHFEVNPVPAKVTVHAGSKLFLPCSSTVRPSAPAHFVAEHPWKCFYYTNALEAVAGTVKAYGDTLTIPSGEVLKAKDLTFDAENRADLDAIFGVHHRENHWEPDERDCHYALLVNELYAPEDGTAMIGATAEWWMSFYVNGEKVYTTWPKGDNWGSIEYTNHVFPVPLKKGRNLVVLYTHRGLGRWFAAFGEAPKMPSSWSRQTVERYFFPETEQVECGPWLTDPAADSVTISFILPRTRRAGVEYRKVGAETWTKVWQQAAIQKRTGDLFRYELKGLEPDAKYEYRVVTIVGTETKRSPLHHFRTFSAKPQTVRLTVTADLHLDGPESADNRFVPMSKMPNALDADIFVSLGDSTSRGEDIRSGMIDYYMKGLLRTFGHDRYVFTVHGNHEWRGENASEYFRYFPKGYYSARVGEAFLLVLDSGERDPIDTWQGKADPDAAYNVFDTAYMAEQRKWLEAEVKSEACRTAKFRIVMLHCPPTCTLKYETPHMKALLDGLLVCWEKGKKPEVLTHLWLTGHKHESWFRERMGINELQICGPHHAGGGLGCATVEIGPDAIHLKDWHVRWNKLAYDVTITPDGKATKTVGK